MLLVFRKVFIFVFLLSSCFAFAQKEERDIKKRMDFIYELSTINIDEALIEAKKLEIQFENNNYNKAIINYLLVQLKLAKGEKQEAIDICLASLALAKEHNPAMVSRYKTLLAMCYTENFQYKEALELYDEILGSFDGNTPKDMVLSTKFSLADLNKRINKNRESLNILLQLYSNEELFKNNLPIRPKLILDIADLYNELEKSDSTQYFLNHYKENLMSEAPEMVKSLEYKVIGNILFSEKKYDEAISNYNIYIRDYNTFFQNYDAEILLKKSRAFYELGQLDSTRANLEFATIQKDFLKKLSIKSEADYYKLYSDLYKKFGNDQLSNSFFKKYVVANEEFNQSKFTTQEGLHDLKTKEILAEGEQTEKKYKVYIAIISTFLGILIVLGVVFYIFKTNKDKKRFAQLIATVDAYEAKQKNKEVPEKGSIVENLPRNIERDTKKIAEITINEPEPIASEDDQIEGSESTDSSPIKDEKVQELLKKLENLKESGYFLRQDSSLYNTAKKLKTNTSYLSSVINNNMGTNFNRFVNDIRMDYIILELKNNKRMRSYSVKGISEEIGYKSADSFTKYFRESTGLSPSAFIRNLNKEFKI